MKKLLCLLYLTALFAVSCDDEKLSSDKQITSYKLEAEKNGLPNDIVATIDHSDYTINLGCIPVGREFVATFESQGIVYVGTNLQYSGATFNSYDRPLEYTVITEDGTQAVYTLVCSLAPHVEMKSFEVEFLQNGKKTSTKGVFSDDLSTIFITPESQNWISNLENAVVSFEAEGTVYVENKEQTSGETPNNFLKDLTYQVRNDFEERSYRIMLISTQNT
ncbi:hypothetical protein M2459_001064 [Parabacteroides sp. PF5-5]|uniref:hypothetical protein n=1 Tax=unclassified Parabacteroides TaxID=2649774 RepID=UPI002472F1AD|nr:MULTISPECIES: hypothetical protein [unclassified Parabacteroides]MDH6304332.1 hypothetical protein [Parabacteroides sp. PH5-39]MDH6315515.1 hypothetical protein [Parabacteroides sp. PF5-13]MDH6318991.1 hypothetical protein [Parabacteroides sp. PH5-13]MDH6322720.1 hypothetical protein [Parabacteroides sp. PH5-8]MDH6326708.1 hypothetical protein [Parabacteroides sp. PH5-41]